MARTLYIHCGVHRTGTTLIQTYLFKNRDYFLNHGIIYPFDEENHQSIVNAIKYGRLDAPELVERLEAAAADKPGSILLSGEDFCSIPHADWLQGLKENFDVKIIFYMRRQDLWVNSWYNQHVKWPWNRELCSLDPTEFLSRLDEFFWIDYAATLDLWASVVGKNNLMLGVVEKSQVADIIPDLLAKIGVRAEDTPSYEDANANSSVSPLAIAALRYGRLLSLQPEHRLQLVQTVSEAAERMAPKMSGMIYTPQQRRQIMEKYRDSNARVAQDYLGRSDGRLFLDRDVSDDEAYAQPPHDLVEKLARELIAPFVALHGARQGPIYAPKKMVNAPNLAKGRAPSAQHTRIHAMSKVSGEAKKSSHWSDEVHPMSQAAMKFSGGKDRSHETILAKVQEVYPFHSVVDLGTGGGRWLKTAIEMNIPDVRGYDIPEIDVSQRQFPAEKFFPADLSKPLTIDRRFDLAITTEVAEHIPIEGIERFIENVCKLSDVVLFSGAVPYQGGVGHVNENWVEYWAKLFQQNDYDCYDWLRAQVWHDTAVRSYYRQNVMMFATRQRYLEMTRRFGAPTLRPLTLIHPEQYVKAVNRSLPKDAQHLARDVEQYYDCVFKPVSELTPTTGRYFYGKEKLSFDSFVAGKADKKDAPKKDEA